jgi:hypothetical protein
VVQNERCQTVCDELTVRQLAASLTQPVLAPHRYARYNETSFVEETFEQALRRGRLRDLPAVLVVTSYGDPPRFPLDWINRQPWPAFVSTKVGVGLHCGSGACDESRSWRGGE